MIIELEKYNSAEELHIETRATGSQGHVCYRNGDWRASVTRVAVCMELEGKGCEQAQGRKQMGSEWGMSTRDAGDNCEQSKKY